MEWTSTIGTVAAILTTLSFLPQALKIIKTRDTQSLSLPMYIIFVSGVLLWLIYGIFTGLLPIIVGNLVTLLLSGVILLFKTRDVLREGKLQK